MSILFRLTNVFQVVVVYSMAAGLAFFVLATCGRESPTQSTHPTQRPAQSQPYTTIQPSRIDISLSSISLNSVGQTTQLTAVVLDQNKQSVSGAVVTWSSSKEDVATVGGQGLVTAVGNGSASITATSGSVADTALVTVLVPRTDRDVLVAFYENAAGEQWTIRSNWVSIHHLRYWYGVTVNEEGRVTEINLPNNNLRGLLTSELGFLEELESLRLNDNQLTGHLSPELGRLTKLRHLELSSNQLSGAIPAELGQLSALEEMDLSFNRLSGSIPRELGGLTELSRLSLSFNELDGSLPTELGRLYQLVSLQLDHNRLSGTIPRHLGGMKGLRSMDLADNRLTGEIPAHLSLIDDLTELVLDHNRLEGNIPSQLGLLTDLQRLGLAGNQLFGGVPSSLEKLSELTHLHLYSNPGLAGILPRSLTALKLEELLLEGTQLCVPWDDSYETWLEQIPVKTVTNCSNLESNVLTSLYNATNGNNWADNTNWLSQEPVGTWYGVSTDSKGHVTDVDLANNNLSGSVPRQLAGLSNLKSLNLGTNGFLSGPLPRELINLDLRVLHLDGTRLCAPLGEEFQAWLQTIPDRNLSSCEVLDLKTLKTLFALFNNTNGLEWSDRTNWNSEAPLEEWHGITTDEDGRITELNLANNNLIGSLPAGLAELTELKKLDFSDNDGLTGPLPQEWTELSLEYLWMEGTQLCAPPDSRFQTWLEEISDFSISNCTDTRPEWYVLGSLYSSTKGKDWTNNGNWMSEAPLDQWYGVTTDEEGRVSTLDLRDNNLLGELSSELGQLSGLASLNLSQNDLSGTIPSELGQLAALMSIDLDGNNLSGVIPGELGQLTDLEYLSLGWNDLSGEIPTELGQLVRLKTMALNSNDLSGMIPAELGQLTNLEHLRLGRNNLSGVIPAELENLAALKTIDLNRNNLSGEIPAGMGQLTNLYRLNLGENDLSGSIPPELGRMERLNDLYVNHNEISGYIPAELGQLSQLRWLDLSFNNLTGEIPPELGQLTRLLSLNLGSNPLLSGALSESITALPLETLQLGGTALCVPPNPVFKMWLQQIKVSRVASCNAFTGATAYMTQAVQSLTHPVPLVAGEAALLRVFITADSDLEASMPTVQAVFYNGDRLVHSVDIQAQDTAVPEQIEEGMLVFSANAEVPGTVVSPGLEMVVNIDSAGSTDVDAAGLMQIPETGRHSLDVRTVPPFDLTLVPFLWTESPYTAVLDDTDGLTADDDLFWQTRNLLPIADFEVEVREPVWTSTDPSTGNSYKLLQETVAVRVMDGSDGYYMGVLRAGGGQFTRPIYGQAELPGTSSVSVLDAEIIAHEIGHNLNLRHSPCGGAPGPDPHYPHSDGTIGSWGYDFRNRALVAPETADLMSFCQPKWIGDYGFTRAINYRETEPELVATAGFGSKGLLIWGGVNQEGELEIEPAFSVYASTSIPSEPGPYQLAGYTTDGFVLFEVDFGMAELADGDGNMFAFVLPVQSGWAEQLSGITLSGPEGVVSIVSDSARSAALLLDRNSGTVRGILRDWLDLSEESPSVRTYTTGAGSGDRREPRHSWAGFLVN